MFHSCAQSKRTSLFACIAVICLTLIATMCTASPAAADGPSSLTAASTSKTKTVYVLVKQVNKSTFAGHTNKRTTTIGYTADGLVRSNKIVSYMPGQPKSTTTETFTYGSKYQLLKEVEKLNGKYQGTTTYKCDKKGRVTSSTYESESGAFPRGTYKYNSKGQLTKSAGMAGSTVYKYDNSGRVKSEKQTWEMGDTVTYTYKYDQNGFITQSDSDTKYKNTVNDKGLLTKQVKTDSHGSKDVTTYTYKKVKVPASAVKMVKSQQNLMVQGIQSFRVAHR